MPFTLAKTGVCNQSELPSPRQNPSRAKSEIGRLIVMMEENANIDRKGKNIATNNDIHYIHMLYSYIYMYHGLHHIYTKIFCCTNVLQT